MPPFATTMRHPALRRLLLTSATLALIGALGPAAASAASAAQAPAGGDRPDRASAASSAQASAPGLVVYLIDHQRVSGEELGAIQQEIAAVFEQQAGLRIRWVVDDSPRRQLQPHELRVLVLASDGTRWFHGPSNVIGLAPHDERGIGRNCFVFYRQALWFRQQAVLRCREATRARTQAEATGTPVEPTVDEIAPAECGDQLPLLAPMIVARASAHEMVHILLNKLDHSEAGLMRESFDLREWLSADSAAFRLQADEVSALREMFSRPAVTDGR